MEDWYGVVKGVKFKYNGPMSDPGLVYKGLEFNYYDIAEAIHDMCVEDNHPIFEFWLKKNQDTVTGYLEDVISGGYFS